MKPFLNKNGVSLHMHVCVCVCVCVCAHPYVCVLYVRISCRGRGICPVRCSFFQSGRQTRGSERDKLKGEVPGVSAQAGYGLIEIDTD